MNNILIYRSHDDSLFNGIGFALFDKFCYVARFIPVHTGENADGGVAHGCLKLLKACALLIVFGKLDAAGLTVRLVVRKIAFVCR